MRIALLLLALPLALSLVALAQQPIPSTRRVVLVDGCRLAELMMRHNIGVKVKESFQIKRLDQDYFTPASMKRMQEIISASIQARR